MILKSTIVNQSGDSGVQGMYLFFQLLPEITHHFVSEVPKMLFFFNAWLDGFKCMLRGFLILRSGGVIVNQWL